MSRHLSSAAVAAVACLFVAQDSLAQSIAVAAAPGDSPSAGAAMSDVVVTATRANEGIRTDLLGSSVTVIEPADLKQRQTRIVSDVLRDVPGVEVSRSGPVGQITQVRIRGAESNHTLTLIDGIKASDPYLGEFDYATLIADEVARVEVLRGQQSALYGSDAIGGVINYITLSGHDSPGFRARIEAGSFGTVDASARAAGVSGPFDYALSGGYQSMDGVPESEFGTRDLGSDNTALAARFTYAPTDNFRIKAIARYSRTHADSDQQDFNFPPGPTYGFVVDGTDTYTNRAVYGLVRGELETFGGHWAQALAVQGVNARRDNYTDDVVNGADRGRRLRASYESTLHFGTESFRQTLTGALDVERENFQNLGPFLTAEQTLDRHTTTKGVVAQYEGTINDRIGFGGALRHDNNDLFDNDTTYRVQGSYRFDSGLRLRAAAGSGTKNPGIFELFGFDPDTFIGNAALQPETSHGWEVGAEQSLLADQLLIGATWFQSRLKDEIVTLFLPGFVATVANEATDSTQRGIEFFAQARLGRAWRIDASYTHLNARQAGLQEVRRAPNIASLNIGWHGVQDRLGLALTVRYNGATDDNDFTQLLPDRRVRLDSFALVNLGADWKLTDAVQLYARIENLTDERYQEVYTYRTAGRGGFVGARVVF
jgi:vitamin B12 transporter